MNDRIHPPFEDTPHRRLENLRASYGVCPLPQVLLEIEHLESELGLRNARVEAGVPLSGAVLDSGNSARNARPH